MHPLASGFWARLKANRPAYTLTILVTLAVGILIGTVISKGVKGQERKSSDATPLTIPSPQKLSNEFSQISKQLEPTVVNINTESTIKNPHRRRGGGNPDQQPDDQNPFDDFFDKFFGGQGQGNGPIREHSLGSGVIVDAKGYIVTNRHVVEKADRIRVKLMDDPPGVLHDAKVIGSDQETDLAVIKIESEKPLPFAKMGNSDSMEVGDWVLAVGSPFGLSETVTAGIVSAKGRSIVPNRQFQSFIQTDAAINPGNSGGPLLNWHGEVIGINTMIASSVGQSAGIGFAIPINTAKAVVNDLVTLGRVRRPALGVRTIPIDSEIADELGLAADYGLLIVQAVSGGAADRAGLRGGSERAYLGNIPITIGGDLIVAINGEKVESQQKLAQIMNKHRAGDTVKVTIFRGKKQLEVSVVLGEARDQV